MNNRFTLTESEKERILNMHKKERAKIIGEQDMGQGTPGEDEYQKTVNDQKSTDEKFKNDLKKNNRTSEIRFPQVDIKNKDYTVDKVSQFAFKIDEVVLPAIFDAEQLSVPPKVIKLRGTRLKVVSDNEYDGRKYKIPDGDSYDNPYILVSYLCKRNKENLKVPLDYKSRAETFFNGTTQTINGSLKKETVDFIENNWCSYQPS